MITLPLETVLWCSITEECLHYFSSIEEVRSFVRSFVCCCLLSSSVRSVSPHPLVCTFHLCLSSLKTNNSLYLLLQRLATWNLHNLHLFAGMAGTSDVNNPATSTQRHGVGSWKDANQLSLRQKKASPIVSNGFIVGPAVPLYSLWGNFAAENSWHSADSCDRVTPNRLLFRIFLLQVNLAVLMSDVIHNSQKGDLWIPLTNTARLPL